MTKIEQIKAEIERLKENSFIGTQNGSVSTVENLVALKILNTLLSFIESLEEEPHYTKRNALFDKCVANVDPATMKEVSNEIDGMLEKGQNTPKIKGWVARDYDNEIFFHCKKPQKFHEDGIEYWANGGYRFMVPQSMQSAFWGLCTTDEPIEVELIIHRV